MLKSLRGRHSTLIPQEEALLRGRRVMHFRMPKTINLALEPARGVAKIDLRNERERAYNDLD